MAQTTVVVIEDNEDNLELLATLLSEDVGITSLITCTSGTEFFSQIEHNKMLGGEIKGTPIDLILLDLQMPGENGYDILAKIRSTPQLKGIKVIAVTANVMSHDILRMQNSGFNGLIGKPIDIMRFPKQIQRIFGGELVWEPR